MRTLVKRKKEREKMFKSVIDQIKINALMQLEDEYFFTLFTPICKEKKEKRSLR